MAKTKVKQRVMLELSDEHWQMVGWVRKWVEFYLEDLHLPKRFTDKQMIEALKKQLPGIPPNLLDGYFVAHNEKWAKGFYAISNNPQYPEENKIKNGSRD